MDRVRWHQESVDVTPYLRRSNTSLISEFGHSSTNKASMPNVVRAEAQIFPVARQGPLKLMYSVLRMQSTM